MSCGGTGVGGSAGAEHKSVESHPMAEDTAMDDQDDGEMDDELAMALQMSMAEEQAAAPGPSDVSPVYRTAHLPPSILPHPGFFVHLLQLFEMTSSVIFPS